MKTKAILNNIVIVEVLSTTQQSFTVPLAVNLAPFEKRCWMGPKLYAALLSLL